MSEIETGAEKTVNGSRSISLVAGDGQPVGTVEHRDVPRGERIKTGFRAGLWFWVAALCCLPIPLMHFILVPLNVALGTVRAWGFWTSTAVLENAQIVCPNCGHRPDVEKSPEKWPLKVLCPNCAHQLRLYDRSLV